MLGYTESLYINVMYLLFTLLVKNINTHPANICGLHVDTFGKTLQYIFRILRISQIVKLRIGSE